MYTQQILVVEDDTTMGEVLTELLDTAGYPVTLSNRGAEAINLLKNQEFAVVLSDIRMPEVGGMAVLQAARQTSAQPEVILLTGYGALDTSLEALRAGAFDYLLKPYPPERLLQRVADAVQSRQTRLHQVRAVQHIVDAFEEVVGPDTSDDLADSSNMRTPTTESEQDEPTLEVGALCIGASHYMASFAGEPLHLTPTEHAMLWQMAAKPGKVFTYRELVYAMHDYDVSTVEAKILLKTHIRNLRTKIGSGTLVNIRGAGYKLVEPDPSACDADSGDDDTDADDD